MDKVKALGLAGLLCSLGSACFSMLQGNESRKVDQAHNDELIKSSVKQEVQSQLSNLTFEKRD